MILYSRTPMALSISGDDISYNKWNPIPYYLCKFEVTVPFVIVFVNHWMTKIRGANFAGFC